MLESLNDFETMAKNTKAMVDMAQSLRIKLQGRQGNNEVTEILKEIGFIDPVTKESFGENYELELVKQIDAFFANYLGNGSGTITLTDAFCVYNRVRGISRDLKRHYFA